MADTLRPLPALPPDPTVELPPNDAPAPTLRAKEPAPPPPLDAPEPPKTLKPKPAPKKKAKAKRKAKPRAKAAPKPPGEGPGMGGKKGAESDAPAPNGGVPPELAAALADPGALAKIAISMIDAGAITVGKMAFGPDGEQLAAGKEQKEGMETACEAYLRSVDLKLTPGQAFALAITATYVPPAIELAYSRAMERRAAQNTVQPPKPTPAPTPTQKAA